MEDQLNQFSRVRGYQAEPHSSGQPALQAYTSGRCHTMALALHDAGGGDLVVITPKNKPDYLIHAGTYKDGMVTDAQGHHPAYDWSGMWRTKSCEFDGDFRRVNRAELLAMIPERGCEDHEITEAMPLARALIDAADLDARAWRCAPPAGSLSHVTSCEPDGQVFAQAMSATPRPFVYLAPSPSRAEIQANANRLADMTR